MERNTRQREAVLDALDHAGQALTPTEILQIAQASVASLNLSTIYRHLAALQEGGRIAKVLLPGQAPRFEATCGEAHGDAAHHHHHFHCSGCDRVYPLHACPGLGRLREMAPAGFVVQAHQISLRGLCAACHRRPGAMAP